MSRIVTQRQFAQQLNPWGRQGGIDPQRSDLWLIWFTDVVQGLREQASSVADFSELDDIYPYEAQTLALPEQKIRTETVKRDSRAYQTPSWDEPLDPIRMTFLLNVNSGPERRQGILAIFTAWRALIRAGRGAVSREHSFRLNDDYRINFAFDVPVLLLKGGRLRAATTASQATPLLRPNLAGLPGILVGPQSSFFSASTTNRPATKTDLEVSYTFRLIKLWLVGWQVQQLSHEETKLLQITATFCADDIVPSAYNAPAGSLADPILIAPN